MEWARTVEYRTIIEVDDDDHVVIARKSDMEEEFAIIIDNFFVTDCEELPTHDMLVELIEENNEISRRTSSGFRVS